MKNASEEVLAVLQKRGYRITNARTEVIALFAASSVPLSIQELYKRVRIDEVSVYRTVALLQKEKLLEEIKTKGGQARYALAHGHHHHVICRECNKVVHVACDTEPKIPKKVAGFVHIDSHELTFYGVCTLCA